jgi:lysylphosphatidylglycerol synthetase-like protein (DUF2156 family)
MLMAIEEHGAGKQRVRFRLWPVWSLGGFLLLLLFALLSTGAALDGAWVASLILGGVALLLALRMLEECANALMNLLLVLKQREQVTYPISSDSSQHLEVARGQS